MHSLSGRSTPGVRPSDVLSGLDDTLAERLLPPGAFALVERLDPGLLSGGQRAVTLGQLFSIETVIDDPSRRAELLNLLSPEKHAELTMRLGRPIEEIATDGYVLRAPERRTTLGFFGASPGPERTAVSAPPPDRIGAARGLFPHQKRAASEVERYLYQESGRVMLHLPTGVGKTRTAISIVATHLRSRPEGLVIWLAAGRELLEQAVEEFSETWAAVGDRDVGCLRFWSDQNPPIETIRDGIAFAGLAKLHSYGRERSRLWDLGDRASLVVFDEAHQAAAATYQRLVETLVTRNPRTGLLGLSATPGRTYNDIDADLAVSELFHRNKVTLDFGGSNPIERLTRDGFLSAATFARLEVEVDLHLSTADLESLRTGDEVPDAVSEALGNDEQRNALIVQRVLKLSRRHDRILVYAASVSNALLIASVLRAMGLDADAVTGSTEPGERSRMLSRFKRAGGAPRVLTNFGVLTTGFDAPKASAAVIARPTKSLVLYSQMVGRVIRGPKAGGTETCEVVTVVDTTLPGFGDVADAFMNWEDVWTT